MPAPKDLTSAHLGHLTVLGRAGTRAGSVLWQCRCDCGRETTRKTYRLTLAQKTGLWLVCSLQCPLLHAGRPTAQDGGSEMPWTDDLAEVFFPVRRVPPRHTRRSGKPRAKLTNNILPVVVKPVVRHKNYPDAALLHVRWASRLTPCQHEAIHDEPGYLAFYPEVVQWLPLSVAELDQHPNRIDWEYHGA